MRTRNTRWLSGFGAILLVIFICSFPSTTLTQDTDVDDETCLDCHEDYDRSLASTAHRLGFQTKEPAVEVRCVSCHKGGETHLDDPSEETMVSPAELEGHGIVELCTQCHTAHGELDNYGYDAHSIAELSCNACHKVHGSKAALLLDDDMEFCLTCHRETRNQFAKRSNHPVLQQNITCLNCHRFVKRQDNYVAYDLVSHCRDCHPEQGGPFLYEHEAALAYGIQSGIGCADCHEPHGSENDRLLKQPGNKNCTQCHYPVGHKTAHGDGRGERSCVFCHTDVHGSFVSNLYLDPDLPAKFGENCYQRGCHSLIR